ncbi:MAG: hypothetical protein HC848_01040 [Limnobacter sp.]|nr:hypothetical protein [Limnobacter sp.]
MLREEILRGSDRFYDLARMPNAKMLLLQAAATVAKKPTAATQAVKLAARLMDVVVHKHWLFGYHEACGFTDDAHIRLTAPQVLAAPLHLYLMSRRAHPFSMLGMVHVRNRIQCTQPLEVGVPYEVVAGIGATRQVRQGLEFDVHTAFCKMQKLFGPAP